MTETIDSTAGGETSASADAKSPKKRGGGLNSMLIADLKSMATGMGIAGAGSMKKAQLVEAIKSAQSNKRDQSGGSKGGAKDAQPIDRGQDDKTKDNQDQNRKTPTE